MYIFYTLKFIFHEGLLPQHLTALQLLSYLHGDRRCMGCLREIRKVQKTAATCAVNTT